MIGQSHSDHGQGPRPWSRSKAMVKVQGHGQIPIRSRAHVYAGGQRRRAAAASAGGGGRARGIGGGGARLARAVGETKIFFSVSSNPGRGGKKNFFFFLKKAWKFFFRVEASRRQWNEECFLGIWLAGFFWVRSDRSSSARFENKNPFFFKKQIVYWFYLDNIGFLFMSREKGSWAQIRKREVQ